MKLTLTALAVPLFVAVIGFAGAAAAADAMATPMATDAMATDAMAASPMASMSVDPMAMDCMTTAGMEADATKMGAMVTECKVKYPDAAAIECMMTAHMETDMAKMDAMNAECKAMYPMAIKGDAMMSEPMANDAMATDEFGRNMGRMMDVYLAMQKNLNEVMGRYFSALNVPTRTDVMTLGNRLGEIESRLDGIEGAVKALAPKPSLATSSSAVAAAAARPPRTKKPATA